MNFFEKRKRDRLIRASLPAALDIWALVMQAGLDFQVALLHYLETAPAGPLRDEFACVLGEMKTGSSRLEALRSLHLRTTAVDLKETAKAVMHGIELGTSLVPLLRHQAKVLRQRRAFEAEKKAALAPLQLMFPLFVFIFPTIFVVLFGPVILTMMRDSL